MRVWYSILDDADGSSLSAIIGFLAAGGIEAFRLDGTQAAGPGFFLLDAVSSSLCERLNDLTRAGQDRVIAIASRHASLPADQACRLLAAGVSDVLPHSDPASCARSIAARFQRWAEVDRIASSHLVQQQLVGQSQVWLKTVRHAVEAACFTNASVLITGESGTGKELVARLVHSLDRRPGKQQFVVLDCSTLIPQLSGSEFFGHERGAFTGAITARDGAFALAHDGTLFLDEVGELPPDMQTQLLRVVQEGTYKRIGGNNWKRTNFRLVCATNRDLEAEVAAGRFRTDLYYRIAGVRCRLPPLRERAADIPVLLDHFISELRGESPVAGVDDPVMRMLLTREYRGNVRELRLLVTRMLYRHVGPGAISIGDVPEEEREIMALDPDWRDAGFMGAISRAIVTGIGLKAIGRAAEDAAEQLALEWENGNVHLAAARLGVSDRALQLRRAARRDRLPEGT